jgi:hypothetical protein
MNNDKNDPTPAYRRFLWWCSGVVPEVLSQYPSERAKYEGIGGAVLTTGVLAFFSGFYAIYSTLASGSYAVLTSIGFGLLWGLAIFNLDRYIVSSLRKPTDPEVRWQRRLRETWLPALPRIGLAVLIGITLSKPLELRLFQNAIAGQAAINQEQAVNTKRDGLIQSSSLSALDADLKQIRETLTASETRAQALEDEFLREADGTGGSRRYGYSEVARVKQETAAEARKQVAALQERLRQVQGERDQVDAQITQQVAAFRSGLSDDFLTKMRALSDLAANSNAVWWISTFVVLLIIGVEITPVIVKLLSPIGPYDIKLDAMNNVETNEALLKRDTTNRILANHWSNIETAERQSDDVWLDAHTAVAGDEVRRKVSQWKDAKAAGSPATVQQLLDEVRAEVLTERTAF